MFNFIYWIINLIINLFFNGIQDLVIKNMILRKENEILKRKMTKRIRFKFIDKLFYSVFYNFPVKLGIILFL